MAISDSSAHCANCGWILLSHRAGNYLMLACMDLRPFASFCRLHSLEFTDFALDTPFAFEADVVEFIQIMNALMHGAYLGFVFGMRYATLMDLLMTISRLRQLDPET